MTKNMQQQEENLENLTTPTQQQEGNLENLTTPTAVQPSRKSASPILSGIAVVLSSLALVGTVVTLQQISQLRQATNELKTSLRKATVAPSPAPTTNVAAPANNTSATIQPGQFIQSAFGTSVQVELLSVKRIENPETGKRDVVDVQMRIRRIGDNNLASDSSIDVYGTTARNSATTETYGAVGIDRSTGGVFLWTIRKGASADAYVWLKIPEEVNTVSLFVPQTQVFKDVPIAN
jgi:hypothetical protein